MEVDRPPIFVDHQLQPDFAPCPGCHELINFSKLGAYDFCPKCGQFIVNLAELDKEG